MGEAIYWIKPRWGARKCEEMSENISKYNLTTLPQAGTQAGAGPEPARALFPGAAFDFDKPEPPWAKPGRGHHYPGLGAELPVRDIS
jgi:hypothetical protein